MIDNFDNVRNAFYINRKGKRERQVISLDGFYINALASINVSKQDVPQWVQAQVDDWTAFDSQLPITRQVKYLIMREVVNGLSGSDDVFYPAMTSESPNTDTKPLGSIAVYGDDALNTDIAGLLKCGVGNRSKISNAKKPAKLALGLSIKRGVKMTPDKNKAIIEWLKVNVKTL